MKFSHAAGPVLANLILTALFVVTSSLTGCQTEETPVAMESAPAATATLVVVTGDVPLEEVPRESVTWSDNKLTAFGILKLGGHDVESSGAGETRFVSAIDGIQNLGSAGDNWTFQINGKLGDRSSDAVELSDGDEVIWKFGEYQPESP